MKNHLKRLAAPRMWFIKRKGTKYIVKPNPGGHPFQMGLPLALILRDILHLAHTGVEVKKILHNNEVLVDGIRRRDNRFIVGLFDTVSLPNLKLYYRVVLDVKGRLFLCKIPPSEQNLKIGKVIGKTVLSKGKIQLHLHDGRNVVSSQKVAVGDSVVITIPKGEVTHVLPLKQGMLVYIDNGRRVGEVGTLQEIKGAQAVYVKDTVPVETAKKYLFVVGKEKPVITIHAPSGKQEKQKETLNTSQ